MTSADFGSTWALVPLRGLEDAKTRLGAELDPEERLELVVAMANRTLAATRDAGGITGTVLVTADPAAAELATRYGARTLVQRLPGLNAALREARGVAMSLGATAILVLPIDLPAISPGALEDLLADAAGAVAGPPSLAGSIGSDRPLVLAVPDRHGGGTNALLVSPPAAIDPAFGDASFQTHASAAAAAGAAFRRHDGPLTLDVDTGADLLVAEAGGVGVEGVGAGPARGRHGA
jgi:2-phospho-L-lactate guanylyltransferase